MTAELTGLSMEVCIGSFEEALYIFQGGVCSSMSPCPTQQARRRPTKLISWTMVMKEV